MYVQNQTTHSDLNDNSLSPHLQKLWNTITHTSISNIRHSTCILRLDSMYMFYHWLRKVNIQAYRE